MQEALAENLGAFVDVQFEVASGPEVATGPEVALA